MGLNGLVDGRSSLSVAPDAATACRCCG